MFVLSTKVFNHLGDKDKDEAVWPNNGEHIIAINLRFLLQIPNFNYKDIKKHFKWLKI